MSEPFGVYLENPRRAGRDSRGRFTKRRRSSARRRTSKRRRRSGSTATKRRRRRNPSILPAINANPRRRRTRRRSSSSRSSSSRSSSSRRRRSSSRRRRRNPFAFLPRGGNIQRTLMSGLGLAGGELAGDVLARGALKAGAGRLLEMLRIPANFRAPALRIAVGLFGTPLLKMLRVPASITGPFGAVNVASGVLELTANIRQQAFSRVGLSDYELADVLVGSEVSDVLVDYELADYELADYELAGDYSDQDFYSNYEAM